MERGGKEEKSIHWVDGPEDESEAGNGGEESGSLLILALDDTTAVDTELVDNDEVGNAGNGVPSPLGTLVNGEGGKEAGEDHDDVSHDGDEDVGTCETGQEGEIEEQEWGGDAPVDVAGPVDLTVDDLLDIGDVLLGVVGLDDLVLADAVTDGHGEVGDCREGGDEGCDDVEEAFLL